MGFIYVSMEVLVRGLQEFFFFQAVIGDVLLHEKPKQRPSGKNARFNKKGKAEDTISLYEEVIARIPFIYSTNSYFSYKINQLLSCICKREKK